jgi:energy-coupling factor transporter transmembrane protein EcfT
LPLAVFFAAFLALAAAARVGRRLSATWRRMLPFLGLLFAADWILVGAGFALLVTLRLILLAGAFVLLVATTTADELQVALESLGVPHRLAFVFVTAFSSIEMMGEEWRGILEAQRARGLSFDGATRFGPRRVAYLVPLVVPAIVLATRRAWSLNEAAAMRGFGAPKRRPHRRPSLGALDYGLLGGAAALLVVVFVLP